MTTDKPTPLIADGRATGENITDDEIRWLRNNTGWVGEARAKEHRIIANALHGDPVARGLCAGFLNERRRNDADPYLARQEKP